MLYLDAPIGPINGLMIYRDHQDSNLFYYAPERPRLALNGGVPEFIFLKYKRDITDNPDFDPATKQSLGGGFLAFTVDLGAEDEELEAVKDKLADFAQGEVKLTPIQFRKGSVRLSITKDAADAKSESKGGAGPPQPAQPRGLSFFEEVYGATKPSLLGFNRATFAVVLSQEAATLFEAALRSGISPIGVIYDLEFLGMRPAFQVKITAEYHRVYTHLETEFGARGQIQGIAFAADIGVAFQKLRDDGAIKVEVLNFTDDDNLRKKADEAFDWFKTELLKDFFKSALQPPGFMTRSASGGLGLLGQLQSLFGALNTTQAGVTLAPTRGEPTSQAPTTAPPPETSSDNVPPLRDSNRAVASSVGGGGQQSGADSGLSHFQAAFSLKTYRQEELKTRSFEYSMQAAVAREAAPQGMFSTVVRGLDLNNVIKEVNLDDDFFKRVVATVSLKVDFAATGISAVTVNLEYPANRKPNEEPMHTDGFTFAPDDLSPKIFTTWLNANKDLAYRYRMDINFKPDSPWVGKEGHVSADWIVTRDRQLTLDPMDFVGLLDLPISFGDLDSGQVTQAQVELLYEDPANNFTVRKTCLLKTDQPGQNWRLRLSNPALRKYKYRVLYFLQENARYQTDWITSNDSSLVINEPFKDILKVRLVPQLDPGALVEAIVGLTYQEPENNYKRHFQKVFSPDNLVSEQVSIPTLAQFPSKYSYEATIVRVDGSVFKLDPVATENSAQIITDGLGTTHRIIIKVMPQNLAQAGLAALKVDLVGPGDNPDRDSALFTESQMQDKKVALVQPDDGGLFTYSFKVTGYTPRGVPVPGETGQDTNQTLIVRLPSP